MLMSLQTQRPAGQARTSRPATPACRHVLRHRAPSARQGAIQPRALDQSSGPTGLNVGTNRPTSKQGWADMAAALRQANVKVIAPQELPWAKEKGGVLVDIRPAESYEQGHLPEALSVPFYRSIQGWTPWQVARRVGYAMFGVSQGTEANPDFLADVKKLVANPETTPVVVYCNLGGSLEPTKADPNGMQSRSMVAAYYLIRAGFKTVQVLRGGYNDWASSGRDIEVLE